MNVCLYYAMVIDDNFVKVNPFIRVFVSYNLSTFTYVRCYYVNTTNTSKWHKTQLKYSSRIYV